MTAQTNGPVVRELLGIVCAGRGVGSACCFDCLGSADRGHLEAEDIAGALSYAA